MDDDGNKNSSVSPGETTPKVARLDAAQGALLLVCTFELVFFLIFMFGHNIKEQNTISDTLFTIPEYAIVLSICLASRALGVALFFLRYRDADPIWTTAGWAGLVVSLFGWAWLATHKDNQQHFIGVFLYCAGVFVYSIVMLGLCKETHPHLAQQHFWLELFVFITSGIFLVVFVILWLIEDSNNQHNVIPHEHNTHQTEHAYIVEHCAYIANIVFFIGFFLFHTPDPMKPPLIESIYSSSAKNNIQGIEMQTLLPHIRASVVV